MLDIAKGFLKQIAEEHAKRAVLERTLDKIREKNPGIVMPTVEEMNTIRTAVSKEIDELYDFLKK